MRKLIRTFLWIGLLAACTKATAPASAPKSMTKNDLILIGGTVAVGPQQTPQKNVAIYVSDGVIRDIGSPDAIRKAHPNTNEITALEGTILPGLTDAHGHLYGLGLSLDIVSLVGSSSYDEV